jgi:pimeloyl-ACP methyl ester carboxylesterase
MDSEELGPPGDSGLGLLRMINKAPHKLLNAFLRAGWAVAMTDYEGLGTYGNHPYLLGESEGRGIVDIVPVVSQLAGPDRRISDQYGIVGHSQGGQAALFGAYLAGTDYARSGTLIGVAALAPASNLKAGLLYVYEQPAPFGDLGAFYALFSNGVFGGDPGIERAQIFKEEALRKYLADYDTKARAEMSLDPEWMNVAPTDIFQPQGGDAWTRYWAQVDDFNPEKKITVPIRVSQALGDTRVNPVNTTLLLTQLAAIDGHGPITPVTRVIVSQPDPKVLGAHFGLLMDDTEISGLVGWMGDRLTQPGPESS